MTNEEKALIEYPKKQANDVGYYFDTNQRNRQIFISACEWKDKQYAEIIKEECNTSYESGLAEGERKAEARFKEYLEKKIKGLNTITCITNSMVTIKRCDEMVDVFTLIINELFGEE